MGDFKQVSEDTKTGYVNASNRTSLGKGGLIVSPFLDVNCNGKRDKGEPKVFGLNVRVTGGNAKENEPDSTIIITSLYLSVFNIKYTVDITMC